MNLLFSSRHSGAIDIFKRAGSIVKLKQAMGHSSINVSLTYLRGLEIAELIEEDMLMVSLFKITCCLTLICINLQITNLLKYEKSISINGRNISYSLSTNS